MKTHLKHFAFALLAALGLSLTTGCTTISKLTGISWDQMVDNLPFAPLEIVETIFAEDGVTVLAQVIEDDDIKKFNELIEDYLPIIEADLEEFDYTQLHEYYQTYGKGLLKVDPTYIAALRIAQRTVLRVQER